jgi:hypothetical protein
VELRDFSPIDRCRECGSVTRAIVHEQGRDEEGAPWQAIYSETIAHPRRDCERMVALAREEWPTLW